jgi:hypothetical protein
MLNLTKKEQRLWDHICQWHDEGKGFPTIVDTCRECHTTVNTLLRKTWPNLKKKLEDAYAQNNQG